MRIVNNLPECLLALAPGVAFVVHGNDYDALEWPKDKHGQDLPGKPTYEDLLAQQSVTALQLAQSRKLTELERACRAEIVGGFESSVLGSAHRYDSAETDQLNLIGAAALGVDLQYRCTDVATGVKQHRLHTHAQIAQVLADGAAIKMTLLQTLAAKRAQVEAAESIEEIEEISW
ncbi:MAG TPA: hypothetical protein VNJ47_03170 [Nevskiales bacterium]|nr:hypothetical protein [Nevskiales bacterium]